MLCAGQVYRTSITVQDQDSPPSTATLTITKMDGTSTPEPHTGPWTWTQDGRDYTTYYDYILPSAGLFRFAWSTQGPGTAPPPDFQPVRDFISIVSKGEVKTHLNITVDTYDDELDAFMMAATELVESKVGICVPRQFTDRVAEGGWQIVLPRRPVISVTSVTSAWPGGPSWTGTQFLVDGEAGVLALLPPFGWPFWWPPWDVVYTCGRAVIRERWIHACKEQVRHLWETQRGAQPPALLAGEETFTTTAGWSFTVPRRVLEALEQDMVPSS